MKTERFTTRLKNFNVEGLFEVNESSNMMATSIEEDWNLEKIESPIADAIVEKFLEYKAGGLYNFNIDCHVVKRDADNIFIQYERNLYYLHVAYISVSKQLSFNEAINF